MEIAEVAIVLAQATGPSWKDIWDVLKFVLGPVLALLAARFLLPALNKSTEEKEALKKEFDKEIKRIEDRYNERILRLEKEKDDQGKEINNLYALFNGHDKKVAVFDEKYLHLVKSAADTIYNAQVTAEKNEKVSEKRFDELSKRIDDHTGFVKELIKKMK